MSGRPDLDTAILGTTALRRGASTLPALVALALGEVRHTLLQPRQVVFLTVLPLVFATVLSLFQSSEVGPLRYLLAGNGSELSAALRLELERGGALVETADPRAQNLIARNERELWLRIPPGTDAGGDANDDVVLDVTLAPGTLRSSEALAALRAASLRVEARTAAREAYLGLRPDAAPSELDDAERRVGRLLDEPAVRVRTTALATERSSSVVVAGGSAQTTPGMTLMWALLFGAQTGLGLQRERSSGTLARLYAAPIPRWATLLGKLLGNAGLLVLQLSFMVGFGGLVLGVRWGDPAALVAPLLAFALAAAAFGSFCAAVTRTRAQLLAFSLLAVNLMSALGGLWWPIEVTPAWMRAVGQALPTYWGIGALQDVMLRGSGVVDVLPHALVLLGFAVLFLAVGARVYRYE